MKLKGIWQPQRWQRFTVANKQQAAKLRIVSILNCYAVEGDDYPPDLPRWDVAESRVLLAGIFVPLLCILHLPRSGTDPEIHSTVESGDYVHPQRAIEQCGRRTGRRGRQAEPIVISMQVKTAATALREGESM